MGGKKFDPNQCKVQLKLAITRLELQKNKKMNNSKNTKREIAEQLKAGKDESARIKVEAVIREDFIVEAYEILKLFCELVLGRLGVLQISKECPPDLVEAVASIIYAAPRTEVKELAAVREFMIIKFGREMGLAAVHNKDNCVNARIVHKLSVQTPENYLVFQYLNEIAKSYNLDWQADFVEPIEQPPRSVIPPTMQEPQFPEPPRSIQTPSVATPISFPQFPSVVDNSPIPTFNPNNMPGAAPSNSYSFPTPPSFSSNVPDFPSTPTGPSSSTPSFDFPTPPSGNGSSNSPALDFPTPPSGNASSSDSVPDFDELTARFEKLKKRDL